MFLLCWSLVLKILLKSPDFMFFSSGREQRVCFSCMLVMMFTLYALIARNPRVKILCLIVVNSFQQGFWLNYIFLLHHYIVLDPMSSFKWSAYTLWLVTSNLLEVVISYSLIYGYSFCTRHCAIYREI